MTSRFEGDTVLLTGGCSGIGRAVVERFIEEGANVCVIDIDLDGLNQLEDQFGDSVACIQGDVSNYEVHKRAVDATIDTFGSLDVLVGNAGLFDLKTNLEDLTLAEIEQAYHELFDVNLLGYLFAARAALEPLRDTGGNMVFTSSCSGYLAWTGGTFYVPSKHAVDGMVRRLALELAPDIRVNAVAPGYVPTNLTGLSSLEQGESPPSPHLEDINPIGRIPTAEEYAEYYLFLADESVSGPSTGTVMKADSGLSIVGPS
ncbi:2,3-dihydroxy-2,3-dihydrophenylpropionate dehydrogenase/cis-2,3-dihydrobiphenyl-2,3-diol dehydrogenase [Halopenitus malekzadehii]|uniref:2,3-dihydroxy-2,3-dihydrophenylpropionate dehydrogenase/cis-2,3-dihydrobiphenyl-2,3-diol dehydrogenase n=1 Tax=Halopenitus malekzadehii TaxID=1267564 RepID=A0A1H6JVR4_9EURY|nr:SDR family oxidoreductase [Halopenitus malekzadehii]SEH64053.1 2,3-dihydroxy-2,3-dihydrophenylpropionate dehydrogenase/cis-2,3-dihydrobiphenyl-2,3-diol dehydrogenase [Halopenitus malekzadehii]